MVDDDLVHQLNDLETAQDYWRFFETQYASSELSTQLKLFQKIRNLQFTNIDNYLNTLLKLPSQFQASGTAMSDVMETRSNLVKKLQSHLSAIVGALGVQGVETICTTYERFGSSQTFDSVFGKNALGCRALFLFFCTLWELAKI